MIELSREFIPATDEVWRLQNGNDPECIHFRKFADKGHYQKHGSTRQGIYICTASGQLLASSNALSPQAVIRMMNESLAKFRDLDPAERKLGPDDDFRPRHRWEESYPEGGLDLTMYARDLPATCDPDDEVCAQWNQDRIWFTAEEARQFLPPDADRLEAGATYRLPALVVSRIVRFSVIDTVKGQTNFYSEEEIEGSWMEATIEEVNHPRVRLAIRGETTARSPRSGRRPMPHGIRTQMLGHATFDLDAGKFADFELVALGTRWGQTKFNVRAKELGETPVGFVFTLTAENAPLVAPSFLHSYGAPWVKYPPR